MANLFKALKPTADLGHSGFDLSQKHVFSSKCGGAVPVCPIETVPDDHFQIDIASLHRSMTLNTAAFLRGKFRYDTYFVPYSQLWHPFNQFIDQRKDIHSTRQQNFGCCPVFNLGSLLGFGLESFRKYHWNMANVVAPDCDMFGVPFIYGLVRMLDMLGYGNHQAILIPTRAINPDTGQPWAGTERDTAWTNALDYCYQFTTKFVNLFRFGAFNHIWYDIYRNKYYDEVFKPVGSSNELDYIYGFNFDDLDCSSITTAQLTIPNVTYSDSDSTWDSTIILRLYLIFGMKYVQWKKDLFTSSLPGTQFGSVSTVDFTVPISLNEVVSGGNNNGVLTELNGELRKSSGLVNGQIPTNWNFSYASLKGSSVAGFDVLALKRAEALQAWKQNTLRAGNMVDSNFRAHFGVEPNFESDNNVVFLGSHEAILEINAVTAQADTNGSINGRVGDLAATATAVLKGDTINYDCKDFGVILTISSFVPESEYSANMIDRANRLFEQFDFFTPEYQNIGLESVAGVDYDASIFANEANKVLGYAPRYWMYKCALDKVHGEFANVNYMLPNVPVKQIQGTLTPWVAPRKEYLVYSGFDSDGYHVKQRALASFYCSPVVFDSVLGLQNANNLNYLGEQDTDYFLNNVYFNVKAVRPMSVLGLPQF